MLRTAIATFGQRLGMDALSLGEEGLLALDIADMGRLYLELSRKNGHEELLTYIMAPLPPHDPSLAERALGYCHYAKAHPWPLFSGIHKDQLMLLVRLSEREATGQTLENVVLFLSQALQSIYEGKTYA